ncbi:efflux RND transporter periplasmic adaptor subunit [Halioxenophilus aromaticivorans]|uniref:Multidrug efflux RND transporter periplasmic adaptor subunit AcrA n=1 Tax=Halioxenophilus aromaticivorans TaxID=1306992 RepID=A0AAV3TXZ0_9ALTE
MPKFLRPVATILAVIALHGCGSDSAKSTRPSVPGQGQSVPQVGVITVQQEPIKVPFELPGRVSAYATAEIRPQVDGIIEAILFKEGTTIKKGDALFQLDNQRYQAAKDAAVANVERAAASVAQMQATLSRREKLAKSQAITAEDLDEARTNVRVAQAELAVAKAELKTTELNLNYATVKSPISGIIGRRSVDVGALVTANQADTLATVRQMDPIYVDLVDTSAHWLRIRQQEPTASFNADNANSPELFINLEDGSQYPQTGRLSLADTVVSETTSTFTIRSEFPNPNLLLLPGMFVRVNAEVSGRDDLYLLPQRAVQRDAQGQATALFVNAENVVEQRDITTGSTLDNYWIVSNGVQVGDRVIIDGLQKIKVGATVTATEVEINSNGVVNQSLPANGAGDAK